MKPKKHSTRLAILLLSCFLLAFSFEDIKLSSYAQKQQLHEIINMLQPRLDEGDALSSFQLYLLAASYNGIRNYSKALATIDLLQKQIDQGDRTYVGSDLTVYPQILRGSIYLDQGEPKKAIVEGTLAYKLLHEEGREKKRSYTSQLIDIYDVLGVAHALAGNKADAQKIANSLQNISTTDINIMNGPPQIQRSGADLHGIERIRSCSGRHQKSECKSNRVNYSLLRSDLPGDTKTLYFVEKSLRNWKHQRSQRRI